MTIFEVIKQDGTKFHINLSFIRSISGLGEEFVEVTFADGSIESISTNTLMSAFKHSETQVLSIGE